MDKRTARDLAAHARVATLSTVGPDGRVDLVPCVFALSENTLVTAVDHKPKSTTGLKRLANIRAYPEVALLVHNYDDADWDALWWVRIRGRARVVETGDDRELALDMLCEKYAQYKDQRPDGAVIVVDVLAVSGWAAAG